MIPTQTQLEIESQPAIWRKLLADASTFLKALPEGTDDVVAVGCGTSYYVGASYAAARLTSQPGRSRAAVPAELVRIDPHETLLLISRSGTTGDLLRLAHRVAHKNRIISILGTTTSPLASLSDAVIPLAFADETSVIQTRFPTTALTLLRTSLGESLLDLPEQAEAALATSLPLQDHSHFVFLGHGPSLGLAHEAALKCLEAAGVWTEAYAVSEYLHGPVAAATSRTLVWSFTPLPAEIAEVARATGATIVEPRWDPQVELVVAQRVALELALRTGNDPDQPRMLSRSVS